MFALKTFSPASAARISKLLTCTPSILGSWEFGSSAIGTQPSLRSSRRIWSFGVAGKLAVIVSLFVSSEICLPSRYNPGSAASDEEDGKEETIHRFGNAEANSRIVEFGHTFDPHSLPAAQRTVRGMRRWRPSVNSGCGLKQKTRPLPYSARTAADVPTITPSGAPFKAISSAKMARLS